MSDRLDVTDLIERLEVFEEKAGVFLDALAATLMFEHSNKGEYEIEVFGELHPVNGTELNSDLDIVVVAYDKQGRVMQSRSTYVDQSKFFGLEIFQIWVPHLLSKPSKIRIMIKSL